MPVVIDEMEVVPQEPRPPQQQPGRERGGGEAPSLPKEDGWRYGQVALDRAARVRAH